MPTLTILPANTVVPAAAGASILQAMLAAGIETAHKCGGEGKCGSCHIFVHEGRRPCPRSSGWKTKGSTVSSAWVRSRGSPVRP